MSQCFTVILFEHYCLWRRAIIDVERGWLGGGVGGGGTGLAIQERLIKDRMTQRK